MYDGLHVYHVRRRHVSHCSQHDADVAYDYFVHVLNADGYDDVCVPYSCFFSKVYLSVSNELHNSGNDLYNFCFVELLHSQINKNDN